MTDSPPWFTKQWVNLVDERRGVVAAACYTFVGTCFVLLALVQGSSPILRMLELVAGVIVVGFGTTIAATLRWRRVHATATP